MYIIRADGNSTIGMGHVMRCLSIAQAMQEEGIEPIFITACEECTKTIEDRGFSTILLPTDYRHMEEEIPYIQEFLQKDEDRISIFEDILDRKSNVILVDSYQVTDNYFSELSNLGKVVCLEDLGRGYKVDALINYNIYAPDLRQKYEQGENEPSTLFLGTKYMPMRKEFLADNKYQIEETVTNVMITTGGSDPLFLSKDIVDSLLACEGINGVTYHVISGPMNKFADELKARYKDVENVVVHENANMKDEMLKCDVVITATGSTIYEASVLGIPMICFYFVENQRQGAQMIEKITDIVNAGDLSGNDTGVTKQEGLEKICAALTKCCKEPDFRKHISEQERKLVDGLGASRIAKIIRDIG